MTEIRTLALVGSVGGAGTTRTAVECAAALARAGRDVAVLDAAYATQGLSEFVAGRIDPDVTELCLDPDRPLATGLYDLAHDPGVEGRIALAPARAPFERVARAKAPAAARAFEERVREAVDEFEYAIVDAPPIASNQAVAAVHAVDRVALVAPATDHGAAGRNRQRDALDDVDAPDGEPLDVAVGATAGDAEADATIPEADGGPAIRPAALGEDRAAAGVVAATETLFGRDLGLDPERDGVADRVRAGVERVRGGRD
ncbi:ParA family protein [Halobaculum sp. CBA1158]|uniref:ParA family protein n=1 Tax=Halobaculum sp. CBA1158 TaxID=2904243 RepID=UPI001F41FEB3|nr:ParA family protein [Halobaculum sp. CBA1158]UIP00198.1 ParA family protein [Halobaculum sp. CBA1158]